MNDGFLHGASKQRKYERMFFGVYAFSQMLSSVAQSRGDATNRMSKCGEFFFSLSMVLALT